MRPPRSARAIVTLLAGLALSAAPASAFNFSTTSSGQNLHWPSFPIRYLLNPLGAPGVPDSLPAVRNAFQSWVRVPATTIQFAEGGPTSLTAARLDGTNVVFWQTGALDPDRFSEGTLAVTTTFFRLSGEIVESDIEFNGANVSWGAGGESARFDVESVALHEIGHLLGLDHTQDRNTIMFPSIGRGQIKRVPSGDEINAVQSLYPGAGPPPGSLPLTATAGASPLTGTAPLSVDFTTTVSGGTAPYRFAWIFGDGQTSALQNPSNLYRSPGTFNATVTITDAGGRTASGAVSVSVSAPRAAPTPTPTPTGALGQGRLTVTPRRAGSGDRVVFTVAGRPGQLAILLVSTDSSGVLVGGRELALGPDFEVLGAGLVDPLGVYVLVVRVPQFLLQRTFYFQAALTSDPLDLRGFTLTNGAILMVTGSDPSPAGLHGEADPGEGGNSP